MPWIIDYPLVLDQMRSQGLRCLYFNSGAFAFPAAVELKIVDWATDATPATLAERFVAAWTSLSPDGPARVMPMSHWNHELIGNGAADALSALLERIGIDAGQLAQRTNAAAIEFDAAGEAESLRTLVEWVISSSSNSPADAEAPRGGDFQIAFPRKPMLCSIGRGKPIRWQTPDDGLAAELRRIGTFEAATDDTDAHR